MDWLRQDWEHESQKDEIYLMEHKIQMELEWQQWEEEQENKRRKPAVIKLIKPITEKQDEVNYNTSSL
jgi:hypothetical protein